MKTPCELIVWNIVPVIKREFAKSLVQDLGYNQRETAKKLGTTEAAISRYISGKRAVLEIGDEEILEEIKKSAKRISEEKNNIVIGEICHICRMMRSKNIIEGISDTC